jgi:hypothetical protein
MRELHAVWLHGMRRPVVVHSDLRVVKVRDAMLDLRSRHGGELLAKRPAAAAATCRPCPGTSDTRKDETRQETDFVALPVFSPFSYQPSTRWLTTRCFFFLTINVTL